MERIEISRDKLFENGGFRSESARNKEFNIVKEIRYSTRVRGKKRIKS